MVILGRCVVTFIWSQCNCFLTEVLSYRIPAALQ